MSRLIQNLHIQNFKSIRNLSIECDRINIFIGKPNAGKSNILEAISLLGARYSSYPYRFMEEFIRYTSIPQLFNNYDYRVPIVLKADETTAELRATSWGNSKFKFSIISPPSQEQDKWEKPFTPIDVDLAIDGMENGRQFNGELSSIVKKYDFRSFGEFKEKGLFLQPPFGENFYFIARSHPELIAEIRDFLKPNGLELLFDEGTQRMMVVQKQESSLISFPMHLVPDTFQRYIFHLAAIMSNRDSVLLFEEPESHSYAPFVYQLAQHIIDDEEGNQYFITTHNPYFLLPIMQEATDVAVFTTWFENYQTHIRKISNDEMREMLDFGVDIFLNLDHLNPA